MVKMGFKIIEYPYRNWADSMAVSLGFINTVLIFRALFAWIRALSCFLIDRSST